MRPIDKFILHHTAGRGSAMDVVNILNGRGLGIQYIIDRNAKIYKGTKGTKGAHVAYFYNSAPKEMNNSTAEGVEIIANDDSDILLSQCRSALLLVKSLGYSLNQIYGHGEVSYNKQRTEGATCKAYFNKYWNTTEAELPTIDDSLNVERENEPLKKVAPADSDEYITYLLKSGGVFNPTGVKVGRATEMIFKGSDGKKIYGLKRIKDNRVYLFKFENLNNVKFLEMDFDTFKNRKNTVIDGVWGTLTKNSKTGGVIDKETKESEDNKTNLKLSKDILDAIKKIEKNYGVTITDKNIQDEFRQEGTTYPDEGKINSEALKKLKILLKDLYKKYPNAPKSTNSNCDNVPGCVSGYRGYLTQVDVFGGKIKEQGGVSKRQKASALPGFSQHSTGKTFDILNLEPSWWDNNEEIKDWVADNCGKYGFKISYPTDGVLRMAEPWHLYYTK